MSLNPKLEPGWKEVLNSEFDRDYMKFIKQFLSDKIKSGTTIYPRGNNIFRAFNETPFDKVKVVILGQDPYHGYNQANGLCFSVNKGVKLPPSLKNIYKELHEDLGCSVPDHGDLSQWAKQGVLLLNSVLTVESGKPGSHRMLNWEQLTNQAIKQVNNFKQNVVFIMWGAFALGKKHMIENDRHLIITSPHPSPLSAYRGFFGSKPFSKANKFLEYTNQEPIEWCL